MKRLAWLLLLPLVGVSYFALARPPTIREPDIVNENLPKGLRFPEANFGPDGGIVFPLDQKGIKTAVEQAMPELQRCADLSPELYRNATLIIHVSGTDAGDQATVREVHVTPGVSPDRFESCALSVLSGVRFEHPVDSDTVEIDYPISFAPPDAGL